MIRAISVLLLLAGGANAFVYTCSELRYKLLNTTFEADTRFACVVPRRYTEISDSSFKSIFIRSGDFSTSVFQLGTTPGFCVERPSTSPWKIVSDHPVTLYCSDDITLIFTSAQPMINSVDIEYDAPDNQTAIIDGAPQQIVFTDAEVTMYTECVGAGNVTIFTGAGSGEEEQQFKIKSWTCETLPDLIFSFQNVITISVDPGMKLTLIYSRTSYYGTGITVDPLLRVAMISSGRSDNTQNQGHYNYADLFAGKNMVVTATCDPCSFDPQFNDFIQLLEYDSENNVISEALFHIEGRYTFNIEKSIHVHYTSDFCAPQDLGTRQDHFVVELSFADPVQTSTLAPAVEEDPYCGCGLDEKSGTPVGWNSTEIWIDVVVVLDTSEAMGEQSLAEASALVESMFGPAGVTVLNTDETAKFYTRIGVIAMSDKGGEILYNLNMTKSDTLSGKAQIKKGLAEIDLGYAYSQAKTMLNTVRYNGDPSRQNSRQAIYYMTGSSNKYGVTRDEQYFKDSEGVLIVNDFSGDSTKRAQLVDLASEGYYLDHVTKQYMPSIQLFCKANCYCSVCDHIDYSTDKKIPYSGPNADPALQGSGGCYVARKDALSVSKARDVCKQLGGGRLVSIHDAHKSSFLLNQMYNAKRDTFYFWMGYTKSEDGVWRWDDKSTNPYTNWGENEPNPTAVATCAYVDLEKQEMFWGAGNCNVGFQYICEFAPCSVGNMDCGQFCSYQ